MTCCCIMIDEYTRAKSHQFRADRKTSYGNAQGVYNLVTKLP